MQAVHTAGKLFDAGVHGASDDTVAGSDGAGGGAAATEDASKRLSFKVQFLSVGQSYKRCSWFGEAGAQVCHMVTACAH